MRRLTRRMTVVAILATACVRSVSPGPSVDPSPHATDQTRIAIYEATLRHLAGSVGGTWKTVFINQQICGGAGRAIGRRDCEDRFSSEEQGELLERLSDLKGDVAFVAPGELDRVVEDIFENEVLGDVLLHVGPIEVRGDKVDVAGSHYCGGLCAGGAVWMLEQSDEGWIVTGPDPNYPTWIS